MLGKYASGDVHESFGEEGLSRNLVRSRENGAFRVLGPFGESKPISSSTSRVFFTSLSIESFIAAAAAARDFLSAVR